MLPAASVTLTRRPSGSQRSRMMSPSLRIGDLDGLTANPIDFPNPLLVVWPRRQRDHGRLVAQGVVLVRGDELRRVRLGDDPDDIFRVPRSPRFPKIEPGSPARACVLFDLPLLIDCGARRQGHHVDQRIEDQSSSDGRNVDDFCGLLPTDRNGPRSTVLVPGHLFGHVVGIGHGRLARHVNVERIVELADAEGGHRVQDLGGIESRIEQNPHKS